MALISLVAVAASTAALLRTRSPGQADAATAEPAPSSTTPCSPLPYQACGSPPAPFTDGTRCIDDHADYDADPTNGCEAVPDSVDGTTLTSSLTANLVPASDIDRYPFHVSDSFQLFCDGALHVNLTAPAGVSMRLELVENGTPRTSVVSTDGRTATATLDDPSCWSDDSTDLQARVSWVGDARSAEPYRLSRSGSF